MCSLKKKGKPLGTALQMRPKTCVISVTGQNASSKRFFCSWVAIRLVRNAHGCGAHEGEDVLWLCVRRGGLPDVALCCRWSLWLKMKLRRTTCTTSSACITSESRSFTLFIHTVCIVCVCPCLFFSKECESCCHFYVCACWFLTPWAFLALSRLLIRVSMNLFPRWWSLCSVSTVRRQAWPVIHKSPFSWSPSKGAELAPMNNSEWRLNGQISYYSWSSAAEIAVLGAYCLLLTCRMVSYESEEKPNLVKWAEASKSHKDPTDPDGVFV